jgi:exopolyphosphatase / guanosine-5'-triphosphate,3'-diphosphate pyrophosphatase
MPVYAAIDIGSNSIKMLCAEGNPAGIGRVLAEDRQVTRIGQSVFSSGEISDETMDLVMGVLNRMRDTATGHDPAAVRVVATSAVRAARSQQQFLSRASLAAGTEVETISGMEEARLAHLGVQAAVPELPPRNLLVDVGGGSAELILSQNGELQAAYSKPLGAVRLWQSFLEHDPPTKTERQQMDHYIAEKIEEARLAFGAPPFDVAIGTSSSALAMGCAILGIPRTRRASVSGRSVHREQVEELYERLAVLPMEARRRVVGIGPRRAEIILPGVALFRRVLTDFNINEMMVVNAGVREGIIIDLARRGVGKERLTLTDEQRDVVERLAVRFGASLPHVRKVAELAVDLFVGLESLHRLPPAYGRVLEAAAYLLDIGHFVSATRHHKHSFYLVSHVDLPGFTETEQRMIALLCRYHRKAMPSATHLEFSGRSDEEKGILLRLIPLLRLADALDRSRDQRVEAVRCHLSDQRVTIKLQHHAPVDLECWAVQRSAGAFRDVYKAALVVQPSVADGADAPFELKA